MLPGILALGLCSGSCAVQGGAADQPVPVSTATAALSAARMGLAPALRPFYDELESYGDWVLVEPQGWVFRPRVNTVAWRPYQDGHWEASSAFGWVWESNEPFGWITDHYGFWFPDDYQGWVWKPYGAWAPAWVAWVQVGDFVGWAPLGPAGAQGYEKVPGGVFTYVPAQSLEQPGVAAHASFISGVPDDGSEVRPIERVASYHGVHWNAGPDPGEVLGPAAADRLRLDERDGQVASPAPVRGPATENLALDLPLLENLTRRAVSEARRENSVARSRRPGAHPENTPPAPSGAPTRIDGGPRPAHGGAGADSTAGVAHGDSLRRARRFPHGAAWRPRPGHP